MARRAQIIRFPKTPSPALVAAPEFVEVRRCRHQAEALVVRALLESEEIPVVLRSNIAQSVHPFSVGDQAEMILLVHDSDATRARLILERASTPPTAI